ERSGNSCCSSRSTSEIVKTCVLAGSADLSDFGCRAGEALTDESSFRFRGRKEVVPRIACRRAEFVLFGAGVEGEPEFSDLNLVPGDQHMAVHTVVIHVGSVEAAEVHCGEPVLGALKLHMPPGDGDVVEEDVG